MKNQTSRLEKGLENYKMEDWKNEGPAAGTGKCRIEKWGTRLHRWEMKGAIKWSCIFGISSYSSINSDVY